MASNFPMSSFVEFIIDIYNMSYLLELYLQLVNLNQVCKEYLSANICSISFLLTFLIALETFPPFVLILLSPLPFMLRFSTVYISTSCLCEANIKIR